MSRNPNTRREIVPLDVPWLQHEHFPATKQACSTGDGLASASKSTVQKVVQELTRGRTLVDKQLAQLDRQLLAITNYLDGKSTSMFPAHFVMYVEDTSDVVMAPTHGVSVAGDGRRHVLDGAPRDDAAIAAKACGIFSADLPPPTTAMVEDDLASDKPCTTTGLWKYLYAYSFFKTITPEDMKQALQLEDPYVLFGEDAIDGEEDGEGKNEGLDFKRLDDIFRLSKASPQDIDDLLKERLVAALCAEETPSLIKEEDTILSETSVPSESQNDSADKLHISSSACSLDFKSWDANGITRVLRDVGLVEGSEEELMQSSLSNIKDDEVSREIRLLQRQLRTCIERTNEAKRKLRKRLDETKPWLSQKRSHDAATVKRYFDMLHTKKELARKKRLREKKLQRQQALRLGGGGGSGRPLADDIDAKRR